MKNTILLAALFALTACDASQGAGIDDETAETEDAAFAFVRCANVLDFIPPSDGLLTSAYVVYADRDGAMVASSGAANESSGNATVTETFSSSYRAYESSRVLDRGSWRLRRSFQSLGGTPLEVNSRINFELHRNSTGASMVSFDVGVTECSVGTNEATIVASGPNDGRLVIKLFKFPIGG